jgi:hypothetical protein
MAVRCGADCRTARYPLHFGRSKLSDEQQTAASRLPSEEAVNAQLDLDASDKIFSRKALARGLDVSFIVAEVWTIRDRLRSLEQSAPW